MIRNISLIVALSMVFLACGSGETEIPAQEQIAPETGTAKSGAVQKNALSDEKIALLENAEFEDFDGNTVRLSDYEGKVVLLDLWETWCVPCLVSFPTLQEVMNQYPDDFVVLAVSPGIMDSPDQVREFAADHDYTFDYLFGYDLAEELEISGIPFKIYFSPTGEYVKHTMGSRGPERDYQDTMEVLEQFLDT